MLLKVITGKNVWFDTIAFLIMGSDFKILYIVVAMIWQCSVLI